MNQLTNEGIPWAPVLMVDSPTLFPMDRSDFLSQCIVNEDRMRDWYRLGLLSFDINAMDHFEDCHLAEVQIVSNLLEAALPPEVVEELLSSLPKPYRYDPRRLCYNFFLKTWQMVPSQSIEQIREEVQNELDCEISEQVDTYIDELAEEGDVETLEAFRVQLVAKITQAESTDTAE